MTEIANAILESVGLPIFAVLLVLWAYGMACLGWAALVAFDEWCQRRWPAPEDE